MSQFDFIKDIAKFGLENDQEKLMVVLNELIEHSKKTKKINFALQLQSLLKDAIKTEHLPGVIKLGSPKHHLKDDNVDSSEFILEKLTSDYSFDNLVCSDSVKAQLNFFLQEHRGIEILRKYNLPVSNKIIFHGPSGCGKTLAAYVLAGELEKIMVVVNLGAIVSSKLGETSKNIAKTFKKASLDGAIIFIDEFDSLGKVRDNSQDHGEMKRVVNTILQLFDYLPQDAIVVAATNHVDMIDDALKRRFDYKVEFGLPDKTQIEEIISKTISTTPFKFDKPKKLDAIINSCIGLSYYTIQKTLITSIKKSIFENPKHIMPNIKIDLWHDLIKDEIASNNNL